MTTFWKIDFGQAMLVYPAESPGLWGCPARVFSPAERWFFCGFRPCDARDDQGRPIEKIRIGTVQPGKFLILVGGSVAATAESYTEGLRGGADAPTDEIFLPDVHPQAANDRFGYSVTVSGNVAVVGAYQDDDSGSASGSAYIFELPCAATDCAADSDCDESDTTEHERTRARAREAPENRTQQGAGEQETDDPREMKGMRRRAARKSAVRKSLSLSTIVKLTT
jgi:hypothetical protein